MNNTSSYHPAELATVLSYLRVNAVIGWGPLAPEGNSDAFYEDGTRRLQLAKRLLPGKQEGRYRFAEATSRIAATLGDPQIVLLTQRREGAGAHIMTHHIRGANVVDRPPPPPFSNAFVLPPSEMVLPSAVTPT